jgi:hypothetical protein
MTMHREKQDVDKKKKKVKKTKTKTKTTTHRVRSSKSGLEVRAKEELTHMARAPSKTLAWFREHWTMSTKMILQTFAITLLVISLVMMIREVKGVVASITGLVGNVAGGARTKLSNSAITYLCRDPIHAMGFVREMVNSIPISNDAERLRDTDVTKLRVLHAMKHDIAFQDAANPETAIILANVAYNLHMVIQNPPPHIRPDFDPDMIPILEKYKTYFIGVLSKAYIK